MAKRTAVKKPATRPAPANQFYGEDFKKNYNYKICYIIGRFRIYVYDNEYHQKIDANRYQLACGQISGRNDIFTDFRKNFPYHSMDKEIAEEVSRVGMKVDERCKTLAGSNDWFRITFDEPKYEPGQKTIIE